MDKRIIIGLLICLGLAACEVQLPHWGPGPRACTSDRLDWYQCTLGFLTVEQCNESGQWEPYEQCELPTPVCDYSKGLWANETNPGCVDGCIYKDISTELGFLVGEHGCFNTTTYGECMPGGVINIVNCYDQGTVCYNNTCMMEDKIPRGEVLVNLYYGQEINDALGDRLLTSDDLPFLLAQRLLIDNVGPTTNEVIYTQSLKFVSVAEDNDRMAKGAGMFVFDTDEDGDAGEYILFNDGPSSIAYNYSFMFDSPLIYDPSNSKADMEGIVFRILGDEYNVTVFDTENGIVELDNGVSKINLYEGQPVQKDGVEISGSLFRSYGGFGSIEGFSITYTPVDKIYLALGESLVDPIFGTFEIKFKDVSRDYNNPDDYAEIGFISQGTDAELVFTNSDGTYVQIPYHLGAGGLIAGDNYSDDSCSGRLLLEGDVCDSTGTTEEALEGTMFLVIDQNQNAHIFEITNIDGTTVDFKDLTYNKNYKDFAFTDDYTALSDFSFDGIGFVQLQMQISEGLIGAAKTSTTGLELIQTALGATIDRDEGGRGVIHEEDSWSNGLGIALALGVSGGNIIIQPPEFVENPWWGPQWNQTDLSLSISDPNTKYYVTEWGTVMIYDPAAMNVLKIRYPDMIATGTVSIMTTLLIPPEEDVVVTTYGGDGGGDEGDSGSSRSSGGGAFYSSPVLSQLEDVDTSDLEESQVEGMVEAGLIPPQPQREAPEVTAPAKPKRSFSFWLITSFVAIVVIAGILAGMYFKKKSQGAPPAEEAEETN